MKAVPIRLKTSLGNFVLRGTGLAGRFLLAIYLTKFLSLEGVGLFGLITGIVGVAPAALGFGLNYYLNREIIGLPFEDAGHKIRDRLGLTIVLSIFSISAGVALALAGVLPKPPQLLTVALIILLEIISFDAHMTIIALEMPILANTVLFVRSSLWIFPFVAISYYFPNLRTLGSVFDCWLLGLCAALLLLVWRLRHWPWRDIFSKPFDSSWLGTHLKGAWLIYLSDLGIVIFQYVDRFSITLFLGLTLSGVYTFYWSLTNSVQILVTTAVLQASLPRLVNVYRRYGPQSWLKTVTRELFTVLMAGAAISVCLYMFVFFSINQLGHPLLTKSLWLFLILLCGTLVRLASDVANFALYTRGLDRAYATINILGIFLSLAVSVVLIRIGGLLGAGFSMIVTSSMLLCFRCYIIARAYFAETSPAPIRDHR